MFTYTHRNVASPLSHFRAWRLQKNFPLDATVEVLVNVPRWTPGGEGHDFWCRALSLAPKGATVADVIALGKAIGLSAGIVQQHLRWLYTWGDQVEIGGNRFDNLATIPHVGPPAPGIAPATAPEATAPATAPEATAPKGKAKGKAKAKVPA